MYKTYICILITGLLGFFQNCMGAITIDSVHTKASTCPNNGSATIYAESSRQGAVFLYNISSGPVTYPQQNDSVFSSLYPGTYTAWVHDVNSFDSTKTTFTISGNYQDPTFTLADSAPTCAGDNNGFIICTIAPATGLGPFTWQITAPYTGTPQSSGTFKNLAPGQYTIKLTDACLVTRAANITVDTGGNGFKATDNYGLQFIGCNTALFRGEFYANRFYHLPLKFTAVTDSGTITKNVLPIYYDTVNPYFEIIDTLYHVNYGTNIAICIADTCGNTACLANTYVSPFSFDVYPVNSSTQCVSGYEYQVYIPDIIEYIFADETTPLKVVVEGASSHTVVDSFQYYDTCGCPYITPLDTSQTYTVTISDECGRTYTVPLTAVPPTPLGIQIVEDYNANLDSTGSLQFTFNGFSSDITFILTSGPPVAQSTKRLYAYHDAIYYPDTFARAPQAGMQISNLPAGTYTYKAQDTCGHIVTGTILDTVVNNFILTNQIVNGCLGRDSLSINYQNAANGTFDSLNGRSVPFNYVYTDVHFNGDWPTGIIAYPVYPGTYLFTFEYGIFIEYGGAAYSLPWTENGTVVQDTVTIPAANDSIIKAAGLATCGNTSYLYIQVDSNNGVLPFQYEVISGPETFGLQDSGTFIVNNFGTYTVGVQDACGNVDTRQISVDSGRFTPVVKSGGSCQGSVVELSDVVSPYFTYVWYKPNGNKYTGDTLIINAFTDADTGNYTVEKIVDINGCRDTTFGSYYLAFQDTFQQTLYFCNGDTLHYGGQNYTSDTILYNTLTGSYGCDSTTVTIITRNVASIIQSGNTLYAQPAGLGYQWYSGQDSIPGATSSSYSPGQSGTYSVSVTYPGCNSMAANYVFVYTGVGNILQSAGRLTIQPNPAHNLVTILLTGQSAGNTVHMALYDIMGKHLAEVYNGQTATGTNRFLLDLSPYAQGVYLLKAEVDGKAITGKLVKE